MKLKELKTLTGSRKFSRVVPDESFSSDVGAGSEDDDRSREAGMSERDSLVSRELGHALGPDQILPMVLERIEGTVKLNYSG